MALIVRNKDLTLTAIFAAAGLLLAEIEKILSFVSTNLEKSPYIAIFNELKPEIFAILSVVLFSQSDFLKGNISKYKESRLNWRGPRVSIHGGRYIYTEEGLFILFGAAMFLLSTIYMIDRVRESYSSYGLGYIARANCEGQFDLALARTEAIKNNPLWSRYQVELIESIPRLKFLRDQRESAMVTLRDAMEAASPSEKLALLTGAKAIFGARVVERYKKKIGGETDPILQKWQRYLAEDCG